MKVWSHYSSITERLIQRSQYLDLDAIDLNGDTPLHIAAARGHLEALDRLLKFGADGDLKNKSLLAPIHVATVNNRPDVIQVTKQLSYTQYLFAQ